MKLKTTLARQLAFLSVAIINVALSAPTGQAQNLLTNGWGGTTGGYCGSINPPRPSGGACVFVSGESGYYPWYTTFATVIGEKYEISWVRRLVDLDGNGIPIIGDSHAGPAELDVYLNGGFYNLFAKDIVANRNTWNTYAVDFIATYTNTYLAFSFTGDSIFFDSFSAVLVPHTFTFTTNNGTITITGYAGSGGAVVIPNTITGLPVTSIGEGAFITNLSIINVTIPDSVTSIGSYAFSGSGLCGGITIGGNVTNIGVCAFASCYNLTNVTISGGVASIGLLAFAYCSNLIEVCFEGNEPSDGGLIFQGDVNLEAISFINGTSGWGPAYSGVPVIACTQCGAVPLSIISQPASVLVNQGSNVVLQVVGTGTCPLNYQWQFNGTNLMDNIQIAGSRNDVLTVANVGPSNSGTYEVVVKNAFGSVTSSPTYLTMLSPTFTNQTVFNGGTVIMSSMVLGTGPFVYRYQWQMNGTNLAPNDIIKTVAGNGNPGYIGDGGQATNASLYSPSAVVVDSSGNLFIADEENNCIRKVSDNGEITTVAGTGIGGYTGDAGEATKAKLSYPDGVFLDGAGNLLIADSDNNVIREVSTNGIITTLVGNGRQGYSGDNGMATNAMLNYPETIILDGAGSLLIADSGNNVIRKVSANGTITTLVGNGIAAYSGDGGAATNASLFYPYGLALDGAGDLLIGDTGNKVIRKVNTNGVITTIAGNGHSGYTGDDGPALSAELFSPTGVAFDSVGNLFTADVFNNVIREVDTNGFITTVAGNGVATHSGDGGEATNASLNYPLGLACDTSNNLFIADFLNNRVREVHIFGSSPVFTLTDVTPANSGNYSVIVSSPYGSVTSSVISLTVNWRLPYLSALTVTNGTFNFSWSAVSNLNYQVQYSTNLSSTNWVNLGSPLTTTGSQLSACEIINSNEQCFYRIVFQP